MEPVGGVRGDHRLQLPHRRVRVERRHSYDLRQLPHLETAVTNPDHRKEENKGMIQDLHPLQIITEGADKIRGLQFRKSKEMVQILHQDGRGKTVQGSSSNADFMASTT